MSNLRQHHCVQEDTAGVQFITARGVVTPGRTSFSPAGLLIQRDTESLSGWKLLALGNPNEVGRHPACASAERVDMPDAIVIPGLVNAHTHLDLTHIGPQPYEPSDGFVSWIDMIRANRLADDALIGASVQRGIDLSRAGGTVAIGDISGYATGRIGIEPYRQLAASGMLGTSFLEFFGIGRGETRFASMFMEHIAEVLIGAGQEVVREIEREPAPKPIARVRLGLQPHAPNTVDIRQYHWAIVRARLLDWAVCTHCAESIEEREFVAHAAGPQRELLQRIGVWDDGVCARIGFGHTPIGHLAPVLELAKQLPIPMLLAHVNDASDDDIERLAGSNAAVVYCPRASEYFGASAHFGHHRYREMLEAGVPVALGTDSIVNLPDRANDRAHGGMSILDEMRVLFARDQTDPLTLLEMGTVHGARALGIDPAMFSMEPGVCIAGLNAVKVDRETLADDSSSLMRAVLVSKHPCKLVAGAGC